MLPARKNPLLNKILYRLLMYGAVLGSFHAVHLRQAAPSPAGPQPVILYGNHSSWWDAHMAMLLNEERWRRDGYVMMEDTQLSRYQFFRAMGAFSVNRVDAQAAVASIDYAVNLLTGAPNRLLLIFPQGEIRANDLRPLRFYTGAGHIARRAAPCRAYPMALRLEFIGEQKPDAFISVGAPLAISDAGLTAKALTARLEAALAAELDRLHEDIIARRFETFEVLVRGAWSINRLWDAVRGKPPISTIGPG